MVERIDAYGGLLFETGRTRLSQLSNKVLLHSTSLVLYPPTTLAPELLSSNNPTNHRGVCMCSPATSIFTSGNSSSTDASTSYTNPSECTSYEPQHSFDV